MSLDIGLKRESLVTRRHGFETPVSPTYAVAPRPSLQNDSPRRSHRWKYASMPPSTPPYPSPSSPSSSVSSPTLGHTPRLSSGSSTSARTSLSDASPIPLMTPFASPSKHHKRSKRTTSQHRPYVVLLLVSGCFAFMMYRRLLQSSTEDLRRPRGDDMRPAASPGPLGNMPFVEHQNGIAYFDPATLASDKLRHPIMTLIQHATKGWEEKVRRQSQTLEHAVAEYRRRYNRHPPRGFDHWYRFAQANNVVLIDEYDSIDDDIKPFLALPPDVVHERMMDYRGAHEVETLIIEKGGNISIDHTWSGDGFARPRAIRRLISTCCGSWLESANISLTAADGPFVLMSGTDKQRLLDAATENRLVSAAEADVINEEPKYGFFHWAGSCPEGSRMRASYMGVDSDPPLLGPSFVKNHVRSMDLCSNPENQHLHGSTAWAGLPYSKLMPVFAHSKTSMHSDIRIVPLEQYKPVYERLDPEWEDKPRTSAIWRGSTTGTAINRNFPWMSTQRMRMFWLANNATGSRKVLLSANGGPDGAEEHVIQREHHLTDLAHRYLDFRFTGDIIQCENDGSCAAARAAIPFAERMEDDELLRSKYLLDLDGNGWSGRFHRLLSSNSMVIKSTIFPEWWSERIAPWVHYVPLKVDYSDIFDIMAFFSGDLDGRHAHDALAKQIAMNGKRWTQEHWRTEDMQACASVHNFSHIGAQ